MTQPDKSLSLDRRAARWRRARLEQRANIAALIYLPRPVIPAPLTLFVPEIIVLCLVKAAWPLGTSVDVSQREQNCRCPTKLNLLRWSQPAMVAIPSLERDPVTRWTPEEEPYDHREILFQRPWKHWKDGWPQDTTNPGINKIHSKQAHCVLFYRQLYLKQRGGATIQTWREPKLGIRPVTKTPTAPSFICTLLFLTFYISAGNIETLSAPMYWMFGKIGAQTSSGPRLWQEKCTFFHLYQWEKQQHRPFKPKINPESV